MDRLSLALMERMAAMVYGELQAAARIARHTTTGPQSGRWSANCNQTPACLAMLGPDGSLLVTSAESPAKNGLGLTLNVNDFVPGRADQARLNVAIVRANWRLLSAMSSPRSDLAGFIMRRKIRGTRTAQNLVDIWLTLRLAEAKVVAG